MTTNADVPARVPKPTLAVRANMTVEQLLDYMEPADDSALAATFAEVLGEPVSTPFANDRRQIAHAILALTANKQNVKALEAVMGLKERHRCWLRNKAAAATTELIQRASRKRAKDADREAKEKKRLRDADSLHSTHPSMASTASQFSSFLVAVDVETPTQASSDSDEDD